MERIGIRVLRHSAFYSPLIATIAGGFLEDKGLKADYSIADQNDSISAGIADGSIHVAQSAIATSWMLLEKKQRPNYVHFAQINQRDGFFLTARSTEEMTDRPFQWTDLVGKTLLADHFFQPLAMLKYALMLNNINYDDVHIIDAGSVDEIDFKFRSGEGDFVHQQGPAAQQLEHDKQGQVVIAIGDVIGPVAFSSLCAAPEWLASDMASAFITAYREGRDFVNLATAAEIAVVIKAYFPTIDVKVLTATVKAYKQLGCWSDDINISTEAYEKALDIFEYSELISKRYPYQDIIVRPPL